MGLPVLQQTKSTSPIKLPVWERSWVLSRDTRAWYPPCPGPRPPPPRTSPDFIGLGTSIPGCFSSHHHVKVSKRSGREGGLPKCLGKPELQGASCQTAQSLDTVRLHCRNRDPPLSVCQSSPFWMPPSYSPPGVQRPKASLRLFLFLVLSPGRKIALQEL